MNVIRLRVFGFTVLDVQWGSPSEQEYFVSPHAEEHIVFSPTE